MSRRGAGRSVARTADGGTGRGRGPPGDPTGTSALRAGTRQPGEAGGRLSPFGGASRRSIPPRRIVAESKNGPSTSNCVRWSVIPPLIGVYADSDGTVPPWRRPRIRGRIERHADFHRESGWAVRSSGWRFSCTRFRRVNGQRTRTPTRPGGGAGRSSALCSRSCSVSSWPLRGHAPTTPRRRAPPIASTDLSLVYVGNPRLFKKPCVVDADRGLPGDPRVPGDPREEPDGPRRAVPLPDEEGVGQVRHGRARASPRDGGYDLVAGVGRRGARRPPTRPRCPTAPTRRSRELPA